MLGSSIVPMVEWSCSDAEGKYVVFALPNFPVVVAVIVSKLLWDIYCVDAPCLQILRMTPFVGN